MKNKRFAIILCLCGALLAGCKSAPTAAQELTEITTTAQGSGQEAESQASKELPNAEQEPLEAVQLSDMYEKAAYLTDMVYETNVGENTMVSPLSLDMALGLVAGGAKGQTREELDAYLGTADYGTFAEEYMEYEEGLNASPNSIFRPSHYQMAYEIANSIWVRDDRKLVDSYIEKAKEQFDAEIASVSFEGAGIKESVDRINGWVNDKTHELIPTIIDEKMITENLVAILINSLYFESPWREEWGLITHDFTDIEGNTTTQEMLSDTLTTYYENDQATGFAKEYQNGMYFIGILPKETGEFQVGELDIASLLENKSTAYDVRVRMPKLNFETTATNIVDILRAQGVETMFDCEASDLSGFIEMEDGTVTYVSDIIQKTKIELDENGTKAAAVTAVMVAENAAFMPEERPEKQVYLDRPFAFLIYDAEMEQIVFIGKVVTL